MVIRITINSKEIKNPLLVFVITVAGLLVGMLVLFLMLFILLPAISLAIIALFLAIMFLPYLLPKVTEKYRVVVQKKQDSFNSR